MRLGTSSPFNIKLESLRLGDFTPGEVRELYAQRSCAGDIETRTRFEEATTPAGRKVTLLRA